MTIAAKLIHELVGLFVDDGALALAVLGIVVLAAILAALMPGPPIMAGAALLFGNLGVLFTNVTSAAHRRPR